MRILIIEDDTLLAEAVASSLEKEEHETTHVVSAEAGAELIRTHGNDIDLIILDLTLPQKSGLELCTELRESGITTPIIILTGKENVQDKVQALDCGADDYLTKPFSIPELLARVQAVFRRPRRLLSNKLVVDKLTLDTANRTLIKDGTAIPLTLKEYAILEYLMRHPNQVLTREQILDHVWDFNFDSFSNIVDVHINNLRKKINNGDSGSGTSLETVRGVGYCVKTA